MCGNHLKFTFLDQLLQEEMSKFQRIGVKKDYFIERQFRECTIPN